MKIFFFISSLNRGGAQRVIINLANNLAKLGHNIGIITLTSEDSDSYKVNNDVKRFSLNLGGKSKGFAKIISNYKRIHALRQILKDEKPDTLVAFIQNNIVLSILASINLPVLVFGSERNYPPREKSINFFWRLLRIFLYRFATGHIVQTQQTKIWLSKYTGSKNINIIPNSVVWPIPTSTPKIDPLSVLSSDRKIILAVGNKPWQKGFDLLVRVFLKVAGDIPNWDLVVLGIDLKSDVTNDKEKMPKNLAKMLRQSNRIFFPGDVGNVEDWYERADLFILSSRYEGFPNVLLEAMASGCPSIAFDCDTGPREIIENGINGFLIPKENIEKLEIAMKELIFDEKLRKKFATEAPKIKEKFSNNQIVLKWLNVLQKSMKSKLEK
tara:strand:- start:295 stop:1443 length:1149 start_codon:yes stop_codon:yes gene_type:complete